VPESFRFSVKVPKAITHTQKLRETDALLDAFMDEAGMLGGKLACLLVQLPPSLAFDVAVATEFFKKLRARRPGAITCEPRHESWFEADADELLQTYEVARVAHDPRSSYAERARPHGSFAGMSKTRRGPISLGDVCSSGYTGERDDHLSKEPEKR